MTQLGGYTGNVRDALIQWDVALPPSPNTFARANLPRIGGLYDSVSDAGSVALTTQIMTAVPIKLTAGEVVTNISFVAGTTAAGTPTNWWVALYSNAATPALLAQSADQLTGAIAAFATKTTALSAAQTIGTTGIYWAAIMVKATTVPTLLGAICAPAIATGERNLAVTSGAALTTTATATLATPAAQRFVPYVLLT
jgi:hypothetical protein